MRLAMMMALAALLGASGCGTKSCKDGTLLIDLSFSGASASATTLQIDVEANGQTRTATTTHAAGASGTLEVDFAGGYPTGATATVTVTAIAGGSPVGDGSGAITLGGKCATLKISVADTGGSVDMTMPTDDLSGNPDLTMPPDLTIGPDMATCVLSANPAVIWVDSTNGVNDAMHGNQAGCAVKTITYALTLAGTATQFNLAPSTSYTTALGETFPIVLTGTQGINGDPNATGNRATINGGGSFAGNGAAIGIMGTNNVLRNLFITGLAGTSTNECINVATAGVGATGHVIDNCDIHDCGSANGGTGMAALNGGDNVNVNNCTVHNALNGVGFYGTSGTVKKSTFTTISGNGVFCTAADPAVTGCGEAYSGVTTTCSTCANCATFTTACP